jgi:hypothetical protein
MSGVQISVTIQFIPTQVASSSTPLQRNGPLLYSPASESLDFDISPIPDKMDMNTIHPSSEAPLWRSR